MGGDGGREGGQQEGVFGLTHWRDCDEVGEAVVQRAPPTFPLRRFVIRVSLSNRYTTSKRVGTVLQVSYLATAHHLTMSLTPHSHHMTDAVSRARWLRRHMDNSMHRPLHSAGGSDWLARRSLSVSQIDHRMRDDVLSGRFRLGSGKPPPYSNVFFPRKRFA